MQHTEIIHNTMVHRTMNLKLLHKSMLHLAKKSKQLNVPYIAKNHLQKHLSDFHGHLAKKLKNNQVSK